MAGSADAAACRSVGAKVVRRSHIAALCVMAFVAMALAMTIRPAVADNGRDEPQTITSQNGILTADLVAEPRELSFDGAPLAALLYNGVYPGPTLRVNPGDTMRVRLVNRLTEPTNLHFHGIQASPLGHGDNILVVVQPGESFQYEIVVPKDQPPGLYWYHAHIHGLSARQIRGGLTGALIVAGLREELALPPETQERLLVLKDAEYDDDTGIPVVDDTLHGVLQTVNGHTHIDLTIQPNETQLWQIGNQGANLYFHLKLAGHRFKIVAEDGVRLREPREVDTLDVGPAARFEVLIDAGVPGDYALISDKVLTGESRSRTLGTLHVSGPPVSDVTRTPPKSWTLEDLRERSITARRTVVFTQDASTETYRINGRLFEHGRIDTRVPFGSTEEWTVRNDTDDMHVFHIHQLSFQVIAINGKPLPFDGYLDTVRVPERGSVTLILPFTRREEIGTFVYHCHVLKHEDKGMMAAIEVYDPQKSPSIRGWLDSPFRWMRQRWFAAQSGLPVAFCAL